VAGESAEELARRQRERADRLLRSAQMYERGAEGERATGAILDALRVDGWAVFHDVRWPGRARANIDHVVVGPPGVYVIDSKNWTGHIEVRDNTFRCRGRRQDKTVAAAGDAALAVAALLSAPAAATARAVLCFVRDEPVGGWCYDVMVCSTGNVRDMLSTRPAVLTPEQVGLAAIELDVAFRQAIAPPAPTGVRRPTLRSAPVPTPRPQRSAASRTRRRRPTLTGALVRLALFVLLAGVLISQLPRLADLGDSVAKALVPQPATFETCKALRKDHPNGVGTSSAVLRVKRTAHRPEVDPSVYAANSSLDTDDDGVVCERR
jgi:hypothetical protein